jgi:hypothetical protein
MARDEHGGLHRLDAAQHRGPLADVGLQRERKRMHQDVAYRHHVRIRHDHDRIARGVGAAEEHHVHLAPAEPQRHAVLSAGSACAALR